MGGLAGRLLKTRWPSLALRCPHPISELFAPHLSHGITRRAFATGLLEVRLWPLRDFAEDNYRRVDDRPFGGGPGMVMLAEPLLRALDAVVADRGGPPPEVLHFTPTGRRIEQSLVQQMAAGSGAILLCGRYEGIDQRVIDARVTQELSLGDFVLSGGELRPWPCWTRWRGCSPVCSTHPRTSTNSFSDGLLEGPQYSRPERLALPSGEQGVPSVLLSGHHAEIERWRRASARSNSRPAAGRT